MEPEFSLSELYDVTLKATYPMEVNGKTFEVGETIAAFDKIQIANFQEIRKCVTAHGGYDDIPRVFWETTKQINLDFQQGIFSKTQFALLINSKLMQIGENEQINISCREILETDENSKVKLSHTPCGRLFVYKKDTYEKLDFTLDEDEVTLITESPYTDVICDYSWDYINGSSVLRIGSRLTNGYLTLEGKTRVKDDITGQVKTGILYIPKLKLMSGLSMRLGKNATPQVGRMAAIAVPTGERGNTRVMDLIFLDDDIDSDL